MTISNAFTKTFGNAYKKYKGDIGLEIETETTAAYEIPKFSFWGVHADGSLRGFGQEYVLKQPLEFETSFIEALAEFKDKTKGIPFIEDSITTSVHVHLNFLNDDFIVLGNFLTIYAFVENILIRYSGDDRLSNLFCLPICDAEETYHNILQVVNALPKKKYGNLRFEVDNTKYGALNLSALVRYGSLEIRSFRGTTDTDLIRTWVGVLYSILRYSRQKGMTPPQIIQAYKERGAEVLSDIFGEYRKVIKHKDEDALLEQNLWYAVNIAYAVKDWNAIENVEKTVKPKLKDLDKAAMSIYALPFESLTHDQQQLVLRRAETTVAGDGEQLVVETGVDAGAWTTIRARDVFNARDATPTFATEAPRPGRILTRFDNSPNVNYEEDFEVIAAVPENYVGNFEYRYDDDTYMMIAGEALVMTDDTGLIYIRRINR